MKSTFERMTRLGLDIKVTGGNGSLKVKPRIGGEFNLVRTHSASETGDLVGLGTNFFEKGGYILTKNGASGTLNPGSTIQTNCGPYSLTITGTNGDKINIF